MLTGDGLRIVLWVSGCKMNCKNCQNPQTHDFNSGIPFDENAKQELFEALDKPYIQGITFSGGHPLENENISTVYNLCKEIKEKFPTKDIWLYSGYTWEECQPFSEEGLLKGSNFAPNLQKILYKRQQIITLCDVMVDGRYIDSQRDITLKWRGSDNQRVIDIQKSLQKGEVVLWTE